MILSIALFGFFFLLTVLSVGFGQSVLVTQQKQQIQTMLNRAEPVTSQKMSSLLKPDAADNELEKLFARLPLINRFSLFLLQSGSSWTIAQYLVTTAVAAAAGAFVGLVVPPFSLNPLSPILIAPLVALMPLLMLTRKRARRLAAFEEQFPEALNFLSRAMRAGHGFSIGLEMLVADAAEPLRSCFRKVLSDLQLGSSFEVALDKLVILAPVIDVRFFVSAVLLQQGTGGNLGEVLDSMAQIIRQRFQLKGHVKAASAHGRVTGIVLAVMPLAVAALLFIASPNYLTVLFRNPVGKRLVIGAACGQVIGYLCIRKIVNFKV
jgi:tight adherence protein B